MNVFFTLLILGFVAFRVTRFFLIDSLLEEPRMLLHQKLLEGNEEGVQSYLKLKAFELTSCTWCLGFWVSLLTYGIYVWHNPLNWTHVDWLYAVAVAGIQGLLHAYEPSED